MVINTFHFLTYVVSEYHRVCGADSRAVVRSKKLPTGIASKLTVDSGV